MSFKENSIAVSPFGSPSNGQSILVSMAVSTCEQMLSVGFIPCLCSAVIVTVVVTKALIREEGFKCRNKSIRFSLDCGWDVEGSGVVQCGVLFSLVTQLCWSLSVCLSDPSSVTPTLLTFIYIWDFPISLLIILTAILIL